MISPINSALSGLSAASKRLSVSANNIANINSTQTIKDGQVINKPYVAQKVEQISLSGGGVQVKIKDVDPASTQVYNPEDPAADENGFVAFPNVSLENEIINQKLATYDYKANLRTLKVQDELEQSLLDILS